MSQLGPASVVCPHCQASSEERVFTSLSGDRTPELVARILEHGFEERACRSCARAFQPEHRMLYANAAKGAWIVMYPPNERGDFARHEHGLAALFEREFARAPSTLWPQLDLGRPRLVFGQHMLAEAVRESETGLDAAAIECAKLLVYRRNLDKLVHRGPAELAFADADSDHLHFAVHQLATGTRVDTVSAPASTFDEVQATLDEFQARYPALFEQPYISATRYLFAP